ncbi:hypothetical protein X752_28115 [Mesorhizobium sp. LNJC398B00]|nr:hypothetical protein X752_28115 [Mesorhizobium sp. LNJC398B00]
MRYPLKRELNFNLVTNPRAKLVYALQNERHTVA